MSRVVSTVVLATLAATGALVALRLRTEVAFSVRVIGATLLVALIYAGIGVIVGALVRSEMNGSLLVIFIWMFDVFFGPAMGGTATIIRVFPLHFPTLVVTDIPSGHSGPLGTLGLSLLWAATTMSVAVIALTVTTRPRLHVRQRRSASSRRMATALAAAAAPTGAHAGHVGSHGRPSSFLHHDIDRGDTR